MKLDVNIKNNRIWLPKPIQHGIGGSFIEVKLNNISFVTKLTKDGRFAVPKQFRHQLQFSQIKSEITILKNVVRPKIVRVRNYLDVLNFIPETTISGFPVLTTATDKKLRLWYSTKGRPNELTVNRYVPSDFLVLLGYYQAEGGKMKLHHRRGREINFTNTDWNLIADFLFYIGRLIDIKLCKATIRYNKDVTYSMIETLKARLIRAGVKEENVFDKPAIRIRSYTVRIWVSNSLLAEIMDSMLNQLRKYLSSNSINKELIVYFLQGAIAGDGNFSSLRDKRGSLHSYLRIFEPNKEVIDDYGVMLRKLGITTKIMKVKNKNLYLRHSFVNWHTLLRLLELGLLNKSPDNYSRLINAIKEHRNYKFGWLKARSLAEQVKSFEVTR